ncbi:MAG: Ig-like domain-containing protein [Aristaeellaceae bacterium]
MMMKRTAALLLALLLLLAAAPAGAAAVFAFEKAAYEVNAGKTLTLTPILQGAEKPANARYVWSSSDNTVATVQSGKVQAKKAGSITVTCEMQSGGETLYTTSCQVTVLQPVKRIIPESQQAIVMILSPSKGRPYTYQLNPTIEPADASNQQLSYRVSDPNVIQVSEDGLVTTMPISNDNHGGIVTVYIEAMDDSGVKATQKIRVQPFDLTVKTVEMTERGAYRLRIPTYVDSKTFTGALPHIKVSGGGVWLENVQADRFDEKEIIAGRVDSGCVSAFDVRPIKAGTYTLTLYSDRYGWDFSCKYTVTLKVSESAAYGVKSFPRLNYKTAMENPPAMTGEQVTVEGIFREAYQEDGCWCYVVATRNRTEDTVILRAPKGKELIEYIPGDKVEVCGAFAEPLQETTETGLTLYRLVVDIEKIGLICYNTNVITVNMYQPE